MISEDGIAIAKLSLEIFNNDADSLVSDIIYMVPKEIYT